MVLTHLRNIEIVRTYKKATKGRHETSHILRYVPQADNQSQMIRTADILRFVKGESAQRSAKVGRKNSQRARGSSHHSCHKTVASTCEMNRSELVTPNRLSHRQEFNIIKSHEKEALYLTERFGSKMEAQRILGTASFKSVDPGFAPEVLHLSKGRIDQSLRLP